MLNLPLLLIQIAVILLAARAVGLLFRKIHQPQVMGEMVAGILLGPSLLGWIFPQVYENLFPVESLGYLNAISQIGLLLFMFLIGLELDLKLIRKQGSNALVISYASILVPFLLGFILSLYLYPRLSDSSVRFSHFALFMGIAMSITAFPILARILAERKMLKTELGVLAIACAAINDVVGWVILALIIFLVRASEASLPLWATLLGLAVYLIVMLIPVRHFLQRVEKRFEKQGNLTQGVLAILLFVVLVSSLTTEMLGVHALFGAFLAGAMMPKTPKFVHSITEKLNDVAVVLLLPIFFASTGLRTSIGLVSGPEMWFYSLLVIFVAIAGKLGGSALTARYMGAPWRKATALGILMNTRGLMELVLLNIGLDLGVISPALFAMMVIMALFTTFITAPLLEWVYFTRVVPETYPAQPEITDPELVSSATLNELVLQERLVIENSE
jgi:Kef-type K+ transport system membrane component KefB